MIFLTPNLINDKIRQQKNIAQNDEVYRLWINPDYKYNSEIFVYSVKNTYQVLNGDKPEMVKIGPYAYDVNLSKNIIEFSNDSIKYQNVYKFTFNKNASCTKCLLTRQIWIPNITFQKIIEFASNPITSLAQVALASQQPFLQLSVDNILFEGYEDPYLKNLCAAPFMDAICETVFKIPKKIGLLLNRNGTQKPIEISTGSNDGVAGEILSWNGWKILPMDWWNSKQARTINGTDGGLYKSFIKKTDIIYVFVPDLCRSIHLTFAKEIEYKNIPGYRFTTNENLLDPNVPGNEGFCHNDGKNLFSKTEKCLPKGLLDLSHCYNGTPPILFSFPNFLYADKRVKESIIGLNESSVENDNIIIEIEPQTGTLLRTYIRSQINIAMWKGREIITRHDLLRMQNVIVPIFAEYQVVEIGDASLSFLRKTLMFIKLTFVFLCFIPIATGILFIILTIFIHLLIKTRLINKSMARNSNKVAEQVLPLPDKSKNIFVQI